MKRIAVLLVLVLATGCAPTSILKPVDSSQRDWLLSGAPMVGNDDHKLQLPDDHVFELTDAMKRFAHSAIHNQINDEARLNALVDSLLKPQGLGLTYDGDATYSAREAFEHRRANCLSFTTLFVPMARYLGFDAKYYEVRIPPVWDLQQVDTLVLYKHVNAVVPLNSKYTKVIDINMQDFDNSYPHRFISDQMAEAQYYNNRAMDFLGKGKYTDALRYQLKALNLQPDVSFLWSNLATLYNRSGHSEAAELAYRKALEIDPSDLVAISNAARLYRAMGRIEVAAELDQQAEKFRSRNPYYQYVLAIRALGDKDYYNAEQYAQKAIKLYPKEHRFYFLLGVIYDQEGDHIKASKNWQEAMKLATSQAQISRYRHKIEVLSSMSS